MRIVLFIFAGRKANMEVQKPYLERLLDAWPQLEIHLWDLTRTPEDAAYIRTWESSRVLVMDHFHTGHPIRCIKPPGRPRRGWPRCQCLKCKPPYEQPYRFYAQTLADDTIYVKMDDDVLFLETDTFGNLVEPLMIYPNRIFSAMVINNVVCAKYAEDAATTASQFALGDPRNPDNDKRWWWMHTNSSFADAQHEDFLGSFDGETPARHWAVRTRPGEAVSINCIAFTHATMKRLAPMMNDRLGDEGAVDRLLPWIVTSFRAAHLSFGPQEEKMDLAYWREQYKQLAETYLGETTGELTA